MARRHAEQIREHRKAGAAGPRRAIGNTYRADRWRRCLDCECMVGREGTHICHQRGAFAARCVGALGALAFAIGLACMAAEMISR